MSDTNSKLFESVLDNTKEKNSKRAGEDAVLPAISAFSGATALATTLPYAILPGTSNQYTDFEKEIILNNFQNKLSGLSPDFYYNSNSNFRPGFSTNTSYGLSGPKAGETVADTSFTKNIKYQDNIPFKSSELNPSEININTIDWDKTNKNASNMLNEKIINWNSVLSSVPEYGPDLGGFQRHYGESLKPERIQAYTVTPGVNSSRFASKELPRLIDEVYNQLNPEIKPEDQITPYFTKPKFGVIPSEATLALDPGDGPIWAENELADKVRAMDKAAPRQSLGENQSAVVWGTTTDTPVYSYALRNGIQTENPEIHVSRFFAPAKYQTNYAYTPNTHSPYVKRYSDPENTFRAGPHWGAASDSTSAIQQQNLWRRPVVGDVSFRTDLIEARGSLNLADLQAIQNKLGIPITTGNPKEIESKNLLQDAVRSIRNAEGLPTDTAVIDKYARRMPALGGTTAPRTPARISKATSNADIKIEMPESIRNAYDLPKALEQIGLPPTAASLEQINQEIANNSSQQLSRINRRIGVLPTIGAMSGLLDPDAAKLFAQSARTKDPKQSRQYLLEGTQTLGTNTVIGTAIGGAAQMGANLFTKTAPAIAARILPRVATGVALGGPLGLGVAAYSTADAIAEGLTGQSLTNRGVTAFRNSISPFIVGPTSTQAVNQLFPQPRSVTANTNTGTARLGQTNPPQTGDKGAGGRIYAGPDWGWQSPASYLRLQRNGKLQRSTARSTRPAPRPTKTTSPGQTKPQTKRTGQNSTVIDIGKELRRMFGL